MLHRFHQQSHRLHHQHRVRCFHRNHYIGEIFMPANPEKFHARLYHAFGRVSIAVEHSFAQRAVIYTDTDSGMTRFTYMKKRCEPDANFFIFQLIFLVGIIGSHIGFYTTYIVSRIYPHFFHVTGCKVGYICIKMNIGHEWNLTAGIPYFSMDNIQTLHFFLPLSGKTHQLTAGIHYPETLCNRIINIISIGISH